MVSERDIAAITAAFADGGWPAVITLAAERVEADSKPPRRVARTVPSPNGNELAIMRGRKPPVA